MSWRTFTTHRVVHHSRRWRQIGAALLIGLALTVAACGTSPSGGGTASTPIPTSTSTPKPSATSTPCPTPTPAPTPCASWRVVSSPNASGYSMNKLYAVSALSPTAAWAVGVSNKDINASQSLIEQWDGTTWHLVASAGGDALNGVAAISPRDVWAVGGKLYPEPGYHPYNPLIMHWDGTRWSVVPSPSTGYTTELDGVAALAANDVWAVGAFNKGTLDHPDPYPLIERWDGKAWHIVSNPTTSGGQLRAIATIPGTKQLWAVGYTVSGTGSSYYQPLVERWDGSAWKVVTSPLVPLGANGVQLQSVTALSATDAWAVGMAHGSASTNFLAHWDGANWQTPYIPSATVSLASVAAAGPHDVRAVGWIAVHGYYDAIEHVLIEQWDGASWHFVTSPDPGAGSSSQLAGITTDGAGHFWAVGWYSQTLIEHYP